jgi:hypothetical protein
MRSGTVQHFGCVNIGQYVPLGVNRDGFCKESPGALVAAMLTQVGEDLLVEQDRWHRLA